MHFIADILDRVKKNVSRLKLACNAWRQCPFSSQYDVRNFSLEKKTLIVHVSSVIEKKDIEMKKEMLLKSLNKNLPGRKFLKEIVVKLGK